MPKVAPSPARSIKSSCCSNRDGNNRTHVAKFVRLSPLPARSAALPVILKGLAMIGSINSTSRLTPITSTACTCDCCQYKSGGGFWTWRLLIPSLLPSIPPRPTSAHPTRPCISGGLCILAFLSMMARVCPLDTSQERLTLLMRRKLQAHHQALRHPPELQHPPPRRRRHRPPPSPPLEPLSRLPSCLWHVLAILHSPPRSHFLQKTSTSCDACTSVFGWENAGRHSLPPSYHSLDQVSAPCLLMLRGWWRNQARRGLLISAIAWGLPTRVQGLGMKSFHSMHTAK